LDRDDLPVLKALSVDELTILHTPALLDPSFQRPITHLRLKGMPHLTTRFCFNLVESVASTLRHLELEWPVDLFRESIPGYGDLLRAVPQLAELRITADSSTAPVALNIDDLLSFLSSIHNATSIAVLRLTDPSGDPLPQSLLDDVGVVPRSLTHLCWDVQMQPVTYRIESHNERTIATETKPWRMGVMPLDLVDDECAYRVPIVFRG